MDRMNRKIILASASPRRKEIMEKLGFAFEIIVSGCEEITDETEPGKVVKQLATIKAKDVAQKHADICDIVIGADTVVAYKGSIMGKPKDADEAFDMIKSYAGDIHKVYTGVCVAVPYKDDADKAKIAEAVKKFEKAAGSFYGVENLNTAEYIPGITDKSQNNIKSGMITISYSVYTDVHVVPMDEEEIKRYATSGEPLDKAGAYAIQGGFAPYISSINGDYYNVVGLPACSVYALLKLL